MRYRQSSYRRSRFIQLAKLMLAGCLLLELGLAQISFTGLSSDVAVAPCDEFATQTFQDPWDMSNSSDVNNFFAGELGYVGNTQFSNGIFSFQTTLTGNGQISVVTPPLDDLQAIGGRFGSEFPIDTSKYDKFVIRMKLAQNDAGQGMKVQWDRGTLSSDPNTRKPSLSNTITTVPNWSTYVVDLNSVSLSTNNGAWNAGNVTGLSVYPTVTQQAVQIDYIRLEDSSTCGSSSISYSAVASGNNDLYSLYLDDDNNPYNGFFSKLASAATPGTSARTVSSEGLPPGSYKLVGVLDSDFATLEHDNPWNMDDDLDVQAVGGVTGAKFENGIYSGTSSDASPNVYLVASGGGRSIDASKYSKLSFKLTRTDESQTFRFLWTKGGSLVLNQSSPQYQGNGIYHVDLSTTVSTGAWSGTISEFILRPSDSSGNTFSLDWVRLRKSGFVSDETITTSQSTGNFKVSNPPTIKVLQPDRKGGEAIRPWNMRPNDVLFSVNADLGEDSAVAGESKTAYLPDVRTIQGLRGDFYKTTNIAGNGDPNEYFTFVLSRNDSFNFSAEEYHNLCVKMALDRDFDLALGSVTKFFFKRTDTSTIEEFDAFGTIYNRFSDNRWYEYCMDLATYPSEKGLIRWGGTIDSFRLDPHEFSFDSCCDANNLPIGNPIQVTAYYDYVKLRKDDESRGKFALVFDLEDTDTASPTVSWFYSSSRSESGGTAVPSSALSCEGRVCIWDTSSISPGRYYVYASASDGISSNADVSTGVVNVTNTGATQTAPVLAVEAPSATTYCSSLQLKGYALMESRFEDVAAVQVFIDGSFFAKLNPTLYSPAAVAAYPSADSSNTGFDEVHSISSLSDGTHTVEIKAYSMDGGTTSQNVTVTKSSSCSDPAIVGDPDPSGTAQTGKQLDTTAGNGLALSVSSSGSDLSFGVTGTKNCTLVRLGTALSPEGPFTYVAGQTDTDKIDSGLLTFTTSNVPRFVGSLTPPPSAVASVNKKVKKQRKALKRQKQRCRALSGKTKKRCNKKTKKISKKIRELNQQKKELQSDQSTTVYFIADCDEGQVSSAVETLEADQFGNQDGSGCGDAVNLTVAQWFNCFNVYTAQNTSN